MLCVFAKVNATVDSHSKVFNVTHIFDVFVIYYKVRCFVSGLLLCVFRDAVRKSQRVRMDSFLEGKILLVRSQNK